MINLPVISVSVIKKRKRTYASYLCFILSFLEDAFKFDWTKEDMSAHLLLRLTAFYVGSELSSRIDVPSYTKYFT